MWLSPFGLFTLLSAASTVLALGGPTCLSFSPTQYSITSRNLKATIWIDSSDWPGVHRAAIDLQNDIEKVTGRKPAIFNITLSASLSTSDLPGTPDTFSNSIPIVIGTLGKSNLINLAEQTNPALNATFESIRGKWEAGISQVVKDIIPGVRTAYAIIGSDKRGTIYGIYDFAEQIGVSPWYWWDDVPIKSHPNIYALANATCSHGEPSVKYRGIFLNDEQPSLTNWVILNYSNGTQSSRPPFNRFFYSRIFELILRLKGNYLWPAMWNSAFGVDDPLNQFTADYFGVVMGTSHQEPMLRSSPVEWNMANMGQWNWDHNMANLTKFWTEGVERAGAYESLFTIGMRGTGDLPLDETGNIDLLQRIVAGQREILANATNKPAKEVPQVWCLYKEVQGYYERGMRVPDDVILLWADDNWGNIRRLPAAEERSRSGGAGVYYHFDYVGGPRNHKWGNSHAFNKFHHQLHMAKEYEADKLWIVNVGNFKPHEISTDFFLTYAWNTTIWTKDDIHKYRTLWAQREFGDDQVAPTIADLLRRYSKLNFRAHTELWNSTMYSLFNYREAETVLDEWDTLFETSNRVLRRLPRKYYPSYFQLIHHPIIAGRNIQTMYVTAGRNQLYASQARSQTNAMADLTEKLFEVDDDIRHQYHGLLDGKWEQFMAQTHLGYYYWQQPMLDTMPSVTRVQKRQQALPGPLRFTVEGLRGAWPGDNPYQCSRGYSCPSPAVPALSPYSAIPTRWFEVSAGGPYSFTWEATADVDWLRLDKTRGRIASPSDSQRVYMSVDWSKVPEGTAPTGVVTIKSQNSRQNPTAQYVGTSQSITVSLVANKTSVPSDFHGHVEDNGVVSIQTEHFSRSTAVDGVSWEVLPEYGRNLSAVSPQVKVDARWAAGSGPLLEYDFYTYNAMDRNITVTVFSSPSMNTFSGHPLTYGIAVDSGAPQTVQPMPADDARGNPPSIWNQYVSEEIVKTVTTHTAEPGKHTLQLYATEMGFVTEKIIIETVTGAVAESYLGPPESVMV